MFQKILTSRRRITLLTLGLLLFFDLGRSLYARFGYDKPTEIWEPAPAKYANLVWPPGADLPPSSPLGERVYAQRCAVCHGPDGRGNGPAAPSLIPHPRDFTQGQFKYKSTALGDPPSDEDLMYVVSEGLHASAMPYWRDLLTPQEIRKVVTYIKNLSPAFTKHSPSPISIPPGVKPDIASIRRGKVLYQTQGCLNCHGPTGRLALRLQDSNGFPVVARDLTAPWTFRGGSEPKQIWLRIMTGLAPSPMPAFEEQTTPKERWDLVNYVWSLARIPPWEKGGTLQGPGYDPDPVKRGRYLVRAEMCGLCHTQINHTGIYRGDDYYLAGGMRVDVYPHGKMVSRNLTSDPETGLGNWTTEQIMAALQNGQALGRALNPLDMPWHWFHAFSQEDALAIASYLKTLPPVRNLIPPTLRYGVIETVAVKVTRAWPAFAPEVLVFVDGNFGQLGPDLSRDLPQRVLVNGQWIILILGGVAFFFANPHGHRGPHGRRAWILTVLAGLGVIMAGVLGWAIYHLPAWSVVPPEQVARGFLERIYRPKLDALGSVEQGALVKRGRYIYTVASCAMCHHPDGSGGLKISWKAFGTLWTRNISSDQRSGIGGWSDKEIARAIRSGVAPDGRMLHWQGMIWDHASNWGEEDIRAVIAYLRTLPPVEQAIPARTPPTEEDCDQYTFWITESWTPGCRPAEK